MTRIREALEILNQRGVHPRGTAKATPCILSSLAEAHNMKGLFLKHFTTEKIYHPDTKDHLQDIHTIAEVIREQHNDRYSEHCDLFDDDILLCFHFNDSWLYAGKEPEEILRMMEKAVIKREEEI